MKKTIALVLALAAGVAAFGQAVSFTDASGQDIQLARPALRVVSLSPALTEILYAAGAGPAMVAVTSYCNYPAAADKLPEIGGFSPNTINLEAIIALRPDLVVGEVAAHGRLAEGFAAAGLRFAAFDLTDFQDVYDAIGTLGRAAGNKKTADALVKDMKARVAVIEKKLATVPADKRPSVFYEVWDEPLMTAGPRTFIGMVLAAGGARNIFEDVAEDWPMISFEAIVTRQPDLIVASNTHGEALSADKLAARPGWSTLAAVRERRIVLLDGDIVSRPGPRFVDAIELVAKALYPDLF
ncbi:MAG TPA: cobalamin-binding protein [Spirochaetales bacterium]|nr:cobalamin-binding protein [Spirochaetales bacterium]